MASVESAMRSRVTREYFMPMWPMAMPSHTAMAGNIIGVPPAIRTPALTASAILSRFMWPGTISLWEQTMPIRGRSVSSLVKPRAANRLRLGARSTPWVTLLDFSAIVYCLLNT